MNRADIVVVGAGIIGVSTALSLQTTGWQVCLVDRKGVAAETSRGNAGAFAFADIEPLATPGIMRKAPRWLIDPLGPLSVPLGYAPRIAPWMARFWRASRRSRYTAAVAAQSQLMTLSKAALERLIVQVGGEDLMRREGQLRLYEGEARFNGSFPTWDLCAQHGVAVTLLRSPESIAEIQPGLSPLFTHAGYTPDWMNTVDPARWTDHLAARFVAAGGVIKTANVQRLHHVGDMVEIATETGTLRAAQAVVAAGAWSHHLARTLGDRLPLETERGYNTTFPTARFDVRTHLTFADHGFVVTKIGEGLRVGGAVELGGLSRPPNYRRASLLVQKAVQFLPGFDPQGGTQWMGFRPSLPDSLPVIGRAPGADRVIYAFGHGHLGLTQSAGTAELVAALAAGQTPAMSLAPFAPDRF